MSQQAAAGSAGCCCRRNTEPCACSEAEKPGDSLSISGSLTITANGRAECAYGGEGRTFLVSATASQWTLTRIGPNSYYTSFEPCPGTAGIIRSTAGLCLEQRNCTTPACDPPVYRDCPCGNSFPWATERFVGYYPPNAVHPCCRGVAFTEGQYCDLDNIHVLGRIYGDWPGFETTWRHGPASVWCADTWPTATFNAGISLGGHCPLPTSGFEGIRWLVPLPPPCADNGLVGSSAMYQKLCRFPGDSIRGTYERVGGEDTFTQTCGLTFPEGSCTRTLTYTITRTYGRYITVS